MTQLSLDVGVDLTFLICCIRCGQVVAAVPVEERTWRPAEQWGYLALRAHETEREADGTPRCPGTPTLPSEAASRPPVSGEEVP